MKDAIKTAIVAGGMLLSAQAFANDDFQINGISFGGSGCTGDETYSVKDTNGDGLNDQFAIIFDSLIAEQGPGISRSASRSFCDIRVDTHIPQGFQFAILSAEYKGFADLPRGVTGTQMSTYEFPLFSNSVTLFSNIVGPKTLNYKFTDTLDIFSTVWSPCGLDVDLSIKAQAFLRGSRTPAAFMTIDSIDGHVQQVYHFAWRRCVSGDQGGLDDGGHDHHPRSIQN